MRVVVLEKVYGPHRPEDFTPVFLSLLSGLDVRAKVVGTVGRGWLAVDLSGEDEAVALRILEQEMGLAPVRADRLRRFSVVRGKLLSASGRGLYVDIGVFEPFNVDALVGPETLRAQLADGLPLGVRELADLFCLAEGLPLEVKLLEDPSSLEAGGVVEAELSEGQVRAFERWVTSGLDRLVVLGASHHAVKRAIGGLRLHGKVVALARLGLLEHHVICKLGVPPGRLRRSLARRLKEARILVLRPLDIMEALPGRFRPIGI